MTDEPVEFEIETKEQQSLRDEHGIREGMVLAQKFEEMLGYAAAVSKASSAVEIKKAQQGLKLLNAFSDVDVFIKEFNEAKNACLKKGDTRALTRLIETKWKYLFEVRQDMDKILSNLNQYFVQINNLLPDSPKSGKEQEVDKFMSMVEKYAGKSDTGTPESNDQKPDSRPGARFKKPKK